MFQMEIGLLVISALSMLGGHYIPWHKLAPGLVGENGKLYRPVAYAYGVAGILAVFWAWGYASGPVVQTADAVRFLVLDILAAGIGTVLPRAIHVWHEYNVMQRDIEELEASE